MGGTTTADPRDRSLVADRARLAHHRQLPRTRADAGEARLFDEVGAGLGFARARTGWRGAEARRDRRAVSQAAAAAGRAADALACRRALHPILSRRLSRL